MGRPKHEHYWKKVDKEKDGSLKCKKCGHKFKGGVSRIEAHIKGTGGIRKCSSPLNDTTSSNHSEQHMNVIDTSPVGERTEEMTDSVGRSINNGRVIQSSLGGGDQGMVEMVGGAANPENSPSLTHLLEGQEAENGDGVVTTLESDCDELISDLTSGEEDIQGQLQLMESRGKERNRHVDWWLKELQNMKQRAINVKKTLNEFSCSNFNVQQGQMYLVEELENEIQDLFEEMVGHMEGKPLMLSNEFLGRQFEENVKKMWDLLREDKVFSIGIHGMGGVGKTFLATYMESEIKRTKTFKDVVWVTVSHDFTIFKLQQHIAEILKIKLYGDDERERALILASELEKRENIVLILDDVWKYIDMEKVGIPLRMKGNKLIITSRLRHVCQQMDCLPSNMIEVMPFKIGINFDDDWELFLLKLGDHGTPSTLPSQVLDIARSMVGKCDGLPLGISVMARTMKGETRIHWWRHALNKLDKLEMGVEMQEEVLTVLRRSYDNLTEKDVQKCFLYGALLPNPVRSNPVRRDLLIMNHVDMVLLNGKRRLEEIFDEANVIVDKLINHSLLLEDNRRLMMHPLVRKMALNIIKESGSNLMVKCGESVEKIPDIEEWTIDLEVVSLANYKIQKIPDGTSPNCPRLSTLLLFDNRITDIPECFFMHMNALTTLDLSGNDGLTRLPHSLSKLRTLTSLMLNDCSNLKYIRPLGELQSLLRLEISGCSIQVPPEGLENLVNLKWLDMSNDVNLKLVPGSFLPSLTNIQYLDLYGCSGIKAEDIQGMNFLECFAGTFVDRENLNRYVQQTLNSDYGPQTYSIHYQDQSHKGLWEEFWNREPLSEYKCRTMCIKDCEELSYVLPRDLVKLSVEDNGQWVCLCAALSSDDSSTLKEINIQYCAKLKSLFCLSCSLCANIQSLQSLRLSHLESLTTICNKDIVNLIQPWLPSGMFSQLKHFHISYCHGIKTLMTSSLVSDFQNLVSIIVSNCDSMEQIFALTSDDNDSIKITLPKLTTLCVSFLPQIKTVSERILVCKYGFRPVFFGCPKLCEPIIESII
ncbi:putative disease resistance protein At4g10780 isoform X2 [Vigna unguiculata]|uniref:putative disease resistance protein At4g10780 isoform X2 n=1 Tax=Vigna unguiculata TaxID=3917 RepID=UPI0010160093|nr:putative disease resistance protein At4g10780 isoform X2 [Vigna unguiculata]